MNRFLILRCLWKHLDKTLQSIIFEFLKTSSLVAKNITKKLSQPFEELQGPNLEIKLIIPKPIIGTYF